MGAIDCGGESLAISKRGFFFTLTALIFVGLMIGYYMLTNNYTEKDSAAIEHQRILILNEILNNIETDMSKALYISGYRALVAMVEKSVMAGEYAEIDDFQELVLYGKINGIEEPLMRGMTINDWKSKAENISNSFHIKLNITFENVTITQESPWSVKASAITKILVYDDIAKFNKTELVNAEISIIGFEDPLHAIASNGLVSNTIRVSNITDFVYENDTTNLIYHCQEGLYINSTGASFLGRLTGNLSPSPYGIESLVYVPKLEALGIKPREKSVVDYIYFSESNPASYKIINMPDWFMIDNEHLEAYGLSGLTR